MATNTTFSFNQLDKPVFTTDLFYDLFEGGYIDPRKLLSDKKQAEAVIDAIHTIKSFLEQAENVGVIEIDQTMESIIDIFPQHRRLKALCKQQTQELSDKGELITQLIAENQQLRRSNQVLAENAKIAEDKAKAYEILAEKMNGK